MKNEPRYFVSVSRGGISLEGFKCVFFVAGTLREVSSARPMSVSNSASLFRLLFDIFQKLIFYNNKKKQIFSRLLHLPRTHTQSEQENLTIPLMGVKEGQCNCRST